MYKYISNGNVISSQSFFNQHNAFAAAQDEASKLKRLRSECNAYDTIERHDDGGILNGWKLQGVLLLIRHGDRGPMVHVRGINSIDCSPGHQTNVLLNKYRHFLLNTTSNSPTGHYIWNKSGPFHNFPLLPAFHKSCLLGQLTYSGVAQLLKVGDILRQVYANQLGLWNKPAPIPVLRSPNSTQAQSIYPIDEIIIYSTRYRRTFQSAMALMFALVPSDRWLSLQIRESHSLAFCFSDCACSRADQIKDWISKEYAKHLGRHQTAAAVVQWIGSNVLQNPTPKMQAMEVRDAVLSIICHNAPLPCRKNGRIEYQVAAAATVDDHTLAVSTAEESNDLINIDQDDVAAAANNVNANNINNNRIAMQKDSVNDILEAELDGIASSEPEIDGCVEASHVEALMSYTQWQGAKEAKHKFTRQHGSLRAYGLIRSLVGFMLKIISGDKTKFVLYSGHDRTLQFLIAALGLNSNAYNQSYFVPYATRLSFEIYKSEAGTGDLSEYYFRLVSNGYDVTRLIEFCEGGRSLRIKKDSRGNKADLCPVENIIRFIHDDYFADFNATNFKDACTTSANKNTEF